MVNAHVSKVEGRAKRQNGKKTLVESVQVGGGAGGTTGTHVPFTYWVYIFLSDCDLFFTECLCQFYLEGQCDMLGLG